MSKTSIKNRVLSILIAMITILSILPCITVSAYNSLSGGYARVTSSSDVIQNGNIVANIDVGEGVTVLDNTSSNTQVLIECNTPDGPKIGYVSRDVLECQGNCLDSVYGYVRVSASTYYSPDYNHYAGYIYSGENVAVLRRSGDWVYIEYNVSDGKRKRAYTLASNISFSTLSNSLATKPKNVFYQDERSFTGEFTVSTTKTVYSGPNALTYAECGYISSKDNGFMTVHKVFSDRDGDTVYYISYPGPGNITKYGYVYAFVDI